MCKKVGHGEDVKGQVAALGALRRRTDELGDAGRFRMAKSLVPVWHLIVECRESLLDWTLRQAAFFHLEAGKQSVPTQIGVNNCPCGGAMLFLDDFGSGESYICSSCGKVWSEVVLSPVYILLRAESVLRGLCGTGNSIFDVGKSRVSAVE